MSGHLVKGLDFEFIFLLLIVKFRVPLHKGTGSPGRNSQ